MKNRIDQKFEALKTVGEKGFIAYITAGDPTLDATVDLALALEEAGVDVLELGLPFSDPLADGIVNQLAAQRALAAGATIRGVFEAVRRIRETSQLPIVLYAYMNPVHAMGFSRFFHEAAEAGVDGVLLLDLPPDEDNEEFSDTAGLHKIRLIAPTTPSARIAKIAERAGGFIYYVSREGVTGEQQTVADSIADQVKEIRAVTHLPVAVGFGISNPDQARQVAASADAVVVGSAIVKQIAAHAGATDLAEKVAAFVEPLARGAKS